MSTPVNNIPGLPCVSDGSENWMDFINTVSKCYNKVPQDVGVGWYDMYGRSVLIVRKPEYVTQVLKNNVAHYLWGGIAAASTCFFGDKVMFVVEDEEWKQLRRVMSPELRTQINVPKFLEDMNENVKILGKKFSEQQTVDLIPAIRAFHLSSAGKTMFNVKMGCVEAYPASNDITDAFKYFLQELPRRSFDQDPGVSQDYTTDNEANRGMWKASKAVHDIVLKVVKDRMAGKTAARQDMLHLMVEAFRKEHGKDVSPEKVEQSLGANLVELLFAGYNTVVNTIASALYLLATNPEAMAKAREEIERVLGRGDLKAEHVEGGKLVYLECIFKEVLRMYPPAPAVARRLQKDETFGNITVPKDAECMFAISATQNDEVNWKEPEKFRPERFLSTVKDGTWVPFSGGPRSCIGQTFAKFEFLSTISHLLRNFDFAVDPDYQFGMVFNGFGWMAADMKNPWGGSSVRMNITPRKTGPSLGFLAAIGLQVATLGFALYKKNAK